MEANCLSINDNYFECRERGSLELDAKLDTSDNDSYCEEKMNDIKINNKNNLNNRERINLLNLQNKYKSNNNSDYADNITRTLMKDELAFNKKKISPELAYKQGSSNNDFIYKELITGIEINPENGIECNVEKILPQLPYKDTSNEFSFNEVPITSIGIKSKSDADFNGHKNSSELAYEEDTLNEYPDCEELITGLEMKVENDADHNEGKNSSDLAYKQDVANDDSDCEELITGLEMKVENDADCNEEENSSELAFKRDASNNDSNCEKLITGIEMNTEDNCKDDINSLEHIENYNISDKDSGDEERRTALKPNDIYNASATSFCSELDMHTQSDSSDDSNDFDEETMAMFEPVVECEVSEGTIVLNELKRTELEPHGKLENQRNVKTFTKSKKSDTKNIITPTIKCSLCDATFKSKKRYENHLQKHSVNEKVECNMCGKAFPYNRFLRHIMVHTGEKPHACKICNRAFRLKRDLKQHSFTHTGERPYPCKMCGKKFADSSARRKHYQTHTGEKPYTCEICQRAFTQISHLREHQVTHTREKGHTCDMCQKKFTTKSSLQRHVLTHINCCEICGETFTTSIKLERHKELHDSSRPYSCPYCTRRFVKKTDVNTHMLIHSEVKDIICKICNGAFKSYRYLRVHHYHYHTGMEPPYVCPVCKKGFFQEMSLQKHSVAHMPKKRVKCFECKKVFATPEVLEEHICVLDSYYDCEFCDRKYRHKSDLNKHVKKFHN